MTTATPPSRIRAAAPPPLDADGPDRSPDLLGAPTRRGAGTRRPNRRPLLLAFGIAVLVVAVLSYTLFQRAARRQRPGAAETAATPQAAPVPTFANAPAAGVIPAGGSADGVLDGDGDADRRVQMPAGPAAFDPNYGTGGASVDGDASVAPTDALREQARTQGWQEYQQEVSELRRARQQAAVQALAADTRVDPRRGGGAAVGSTATGDGAGELAAGGADAVVLRALAAAARGDAQPGELPASLSAQALAAAAGGLVDADVGDVNGQAAKQAFAAQRGTAGLARGMEPRGGAPAGSRAAPDATTVLQAGTVIPAVLVGGINSDLPGQIVAQVSEPVYDGVRGDAVVVPQGAKLLGTYSSSVSAGQQRVQVAWTRVTYPDGSTLELGGMPGVDQSGSAGFRDRVDNHYRRTFGSALLLSAFSAGVQLSQPQATNGQNFNSGQIVAGAMGQQLGQLGMETARRNMLIQPRLEIRPGYRFNVVVTRDLPVRAWRP